MRNVVEKINSSPVKTYNWLQTNYANLEEFLIPQVRPYKNEFLKEVDNENYIVKSIKNAVKPLSFNFNSDENTGISPELTYQAERQFNAGALIHIKRNSKLTNPVIVEFFLNEENDTLVDNNLIIVEENCEATIIIKYYSKGELKGFHNGFTKIYCKENSKIKVVKVQLLNENSLHFDANIAVTEYNAEVDYVNAEVGAAVSITNYKSDLVGENSNLYLNSLYFGDKKKVIDLNYKVNHLGRRTNSNMITKGVLLDESEKVYRGTIDFKRGAARAKGNEEEYAMVLSPKAVAKSMPLMLCDEEDVEGNHAASAGRIEENVLFYLMSRGFSEREAKKIIIEASLNPILDLIPHPIIVEEIKEEIKRRLIDE